MLKFEDVCKNWGVDPKAVKDDFDWLKADPCDEYNRLTRELGCRKYGGEVVRINRVFSKGLTIFYEAESRIKWYGTVSVSARDFRF